MQAHCRVVKGGSSQDEKELLRQQMLRLQTEIEVLRRGTKEADEDIDQAQNETAEEVELRGKAEDEFYMSNEAKGELNLMEEKHADQAEEMDSLREENSNLRSDERRYEREWGSAREWADRKVDRARQDGIRVGEQKRQDDLEGLQLRVSEQKAEIVQMMKRHAQDKMLQKDIRCLAAWQPTTVVRHIRVHNNKAISRERTSHALLDLNHGLGVLVNLKFTTAE